MVTSTVRWVRGDDDRLHVGTVDGRRLGWHDLRTGRTQLLDPDPGAAAELRAAVEAYVSTTSPLRRRPPVHALATRPPAPRTPGDGQRPGSGALAVREDDLRHRLPGEHLTRMILQRVEAAPPRRWWSAARDPFGPALRHAHQAVLGQQRVARLLEDLGPGWHVLHDVPVQPRSWVDHLLVGPGGVVVLRTAAHPGEAVRVVGTLVRAGSRPVSHVRVLGAQTTTVTERLRGDLPVAVRGVVVVVGARGLQATGLPTGVSVLRLEDLTRWVADLPTVLSRVDVSRLVETAARPGTWPPELDAPDLDLPVEQRRRHREAEQAALARLDGRAREAGRLRAARRATVLGAAGTAAVGLLSVLRPDVLPPDVWPQAVAAVGMIGG